MTDRLAFEDAPIEALVAAVEGSPNSPAVVMAGDQRVPCTLAVVPEGLLVRMEAGVAPVGPVIVELDARRHTWRVEGRVSFVPGVGLVVPWPERAARRDRRRFERLERPGEGYLLVVGVGRAVPLVDVSANGAAFLDPEQRTWSVGERVPAEITLGGGEPTTVSFEVRGVTRGAAETVVHGRFLPPEHEGGDELPADLLAALLELGG